jgi:ribonuclease P protein component
MQRIVIFDPDQTFSRNNRIRKQTDYHAIYEQGVKLDAALFVLYYRPNPFPYHRLGTTVSRKIGGAVTRNRVKRMFREIFRKNKPMGEPHFDLVLNARKACATATRTALEQEYRARLERLPLQEARR